MVGRGLATIIRMQCVTSFATGLCELLKNNWLADERVVAVLRMLDYTGNWNADAGPAGQLAASRIVAPFSCGSAAVEVVCVRSHTDELRTAPRSSLYMLNSSTPREPRKAYIRVSKSRPLQRMLVQLLKMGRFRR